MHRIRAAREAMGISQVRLAALSGYSREQICQWEKRRRTPNIYQYEDLVQALGLRIELRKAE